MDNPQLVADILTSKEFVSGVGGAVIGAVVGGLISYYLQKSNAKASKIEREAERFLTKQGVANSILFKVMQIHSDIAVAVRYMGSTLKRKKENKDDDMRRLWAYLLPRGNLSKSIEFTPEEMGMLIGLGDAPSTNELMNLGIQHADMLHLWKLYEKERGILAEKLPIDEAKGDVMSSMMSDPKFISAQPQIANVSTIALYIFNSTFMNYRDSEKALRGVYKTFKDKLKIPFEIAFINPPDLVESLALYEAELKATGPAKGEE
ncbi:hypothetical protein FZC33_11165 [Labrys sp. KNU-23]|uniref:hypothetical protein n=1 Tax=Labrys sp. KNU-23 TaxID=2789216 RepID=UPI0011EC2BB5|nr:hypothetical protein [Labrys sp. KNU-23]QEN86850.1 hypothetical protein FZC33_11165 [Labrys sp. KNU-23]